MTPFDPFTATMAEAMAQPDFEEPGGSGALWYAALALTEARAELEQNPLDGVALCITSGFSVPNWLGAAFLRQFNKVVNFEVATLDEAFQPPPPRTGNELPPAYLNVLNIHGGGRPYSLYKTSEHLSTLRLRRQYGTAVSELFNFIPKLPRTRAGREKAARILGITEKQVRTLLPKTRTNVKGHKPYGWKSPITAQANDPFGIARKKVPKN